MFDDKEYFVKVSFNVSTFLVTKGLNSSMNDQNGGPLTAYRIKSLSSL